MSEAARFSPFKYLMEIAKTRGIGAAMKELEIMLGTNIEINVPSEENYEYEELE